MARKISRRLSWGLVGLGTLLAIVLVGVWWIAAVARFDEAWGEFFPIASVRVEGNLQNIDPRQLEVAVSPWVRGSFFALDLPGIVVAARSLPWVEGAEVERLWPDTVILRLREQSPVARWGRTELLNVRGERFAPDQVARFSALPFIEAPVGTERQMMNAIASLNAELKGEQVTVSEISLSKRHAWFVKLSNGMEINFGRQEPVATFHKFMGLVTKLGEGKFSQLQRLDLRYPSGFSVVWKSGEAEGASAPEPSGV